MKGNASIWYGTPTSRGARCCRLHTGLLRPHLYVHGSSRKIANSDVVRRIEPLFPPEVWNVHDITVSAGDRTNNFAEAWNRRFETMIGHKSPSIWLIIEVLGEGTREWKTGDHEKYGGGKRGTGKRGTKFSRVEKAGSQSMEGEMDKYRCSAFIETLSNII